MVATVTVSVSIKAIAVCVTMPLGVPRRGGGNHASCPRMALITSTDSGYSAQRRARRQGGICCRALKTDQRGVRQKSWTD